MRREEKESFVSSTRSITASRGIFFFSRVRKKGGFFDSCIISISWWKRAMEDRPATGSVAPYFSPKARDTHEKTKPITGERRKENGEKRKRKEREEEKRERKREACGVFLNIDARERAHNHR